MIEAYFTFEKDSPAAELINNYNEHKEIFQKHALCIHEKIVELLSISYTHEEAENQEKLDWISGIRIAVGPQGIESFVHEDPLLMPQVLDDFHENMDNEKVFSIMSHVKAFTLYKPAKGEEKSPVLKRLEELIAVVEFPSQGLLWPLFGREAGTYVEGSAGPLLGPGTITDNGRVCYVIGNEDVMMDGKGELLPVMQGMTLANPLDLIKDLSAIYKQKVSEIQNSYNAAPEFDTAVEYVIPYGEYEGQTISSVLQLESGEKILHGIFDQAAMAKEDSIFTEMLGVVLDR